MLFNGDHIDMPLIYVAKVSGRNSVVQYNMKMHCWEW